MIQKADSYNSLPDPSRRRGRIAGSLGTTGAALVMGIGAFIICPLPPRPSEAKDLLPNKNMFLKLQPPAGCQIKVEYDDTAPKMFERGEVVAINITYKGKDKPHNIYRLPATIIRGMFCRDLVLCLGDPEELSAKKFPPPSDPEDRKGWQKGLQWVTDPTGSWMSFLQHSTTIDYLLTGNESWEFKLRSQLERSKRDISEKIHHPSGGFGP